MHVFHIVRDFRALLTKLELNFHLLFANASTTFELTVLILDL